MNSKANISWELFITRNVRELAQRVKNSAGKCWIVAFKGFETCLFRYDINNYKDRGDFRNFEPVNLQNWKKNELDEANIRYVTSSDNPDLILAIFWKLNVPQDQVFIHSILVHMSENNV